MANRTLLCMAAAIFAAASGQGCGNSPVGELIVSLIRARFVPATLTVPRGTSRTADFEVTCDRAGLDTPFGRLGVRVKLDPQSLLPTGISATLTNGAPDAEGFTLYPCADTTSDPNLRVAHVAVRVAASNVAPASAVLEGYVEVEPLISGDPSKDSTRAQLPISVTGGDAAAPGL